MDQEEQKKLIDRIEKSEVLLFDLANRVNQLEDQLQQTETYEPPPVAPSGFGYSPEEPQPLSPPGLSVDEQPEPHQTQSPENEVDRGEFWLNKIGITLLLLGLGFLFKYSIDKNWITPLIRVSFGLALGLSLVGFGIRLQESRRVLSPVLLGGGIASFYISGFAAYQLYHLVPHPLAFSFMTGVTLLAYYLALNQNVPALSLVAVIGGLATPFLLHTGSGNIPGLVLYTCMVLAGSVAVFYYRPWRILLWCSWVGGWIIWGISRDLLHQYESGWSHEILQAGILFTWVLYWIVPLVQKKDQWRPSSTGDLPQPKTVFDNLARNPNIHVSFLMVLSALFTFLMAQRIWSLNDDQWGGILLGASMIFFLVAFFAWWMGKARELVALHSMVGTLFLTIALNFLLHGNKLFLAYGLEATALHFISQRIREPAVHFAGSILFAGIGCWYVLRVFSGVVGDPILNFQAVSDLVVISLAILSSTRLQSKSASQLYLMLAYLGFLAWFSRELGDLPNGNGLISIAWGLTGSIIFWWGLRSNQLEVFKVGFATLVVVAIKLLIIDLAHLDVIWRILTFMGFGGAFLFLSYWMKDMWKVKNPDKII